MKKGDAKYPPEEQAHRQPEQEGYELDKAMERRIDTETGEETAYKADNSEQMAEDAKDKAHEKVVDP